MRTGMTGLTPLESFPLHSLEDVHTPLVVSGDDVGAVVGGDNVGTVVGGQVWSAILGFRVVGAAVGVRVGVEVGAVYRRQVK